MPDIDHERVRYIRWCGEACIVTVSPRCCCGSSDATHYRHLANAYTVRIWALNMDGMKWEIYGMVDATELWALEANKDGM